MSPTLLLSLLIIFGTLINSISNQATTSSVTSQAPDTTASSTVVNGNTVAYNPNINAINTITAEDYTYGGTLGIGWGVFAIIVSIIIGVLCCIFGLSTQSQTYY